MHWVVLVGCFGWKMHWMVLVGSCFAWKMGWAVLVGVLFVSRLVGRSVGRSVGWLYLYVGWQADVWSGVLAC